jgi:hypothetical protein
MTIDVDVVALGGGMTEAVGFRDAVISGGEPIGSIGAVLARAERLGVR